MSPIKLVYTLGAILVLSVGCSSQTPAKTKPAAATAAIAAEIRSSPAYAEVLLRSTELQAELESLLVDYTEDYPRIKEIRTELAALKSETARLTAVKPADAGKLTLALGRLIVRKVEFAAALARLREQYKDEHPDVKRAQKKVEIFEAAIKEILG
jgi:uncharacterized protein involved in exopolysaccharide biosynthesis